MRVAKASAADLDAAMDLCSALDALNGWSPTVPSKVKKGVGPEEDESFQRYNREQCVRVLGYLLDLAMSASLDRVVYGYAVMADPRNKCVDPDSDALRHHPEILAMFNARTPRPLSEWHEDLGPVLWWKFPVNEAPRVGCPTDDDWTGEYTHWTSITLPEEPAVKATLAAT